MMKKYTTFILAIVFLVTGCATQNHPVQLEPPIYLNHQQFASDVVYPAFQLLAAFNMYYVEEGKIPNPNELQTYVLKFREPIDWQRFSKLEVSEKAEEIEIRVDINLTNQTEPVRTSWNFLLKKSHQKTQSLQFSVSPQSHLCVRGERTVSDVMVNMFLDFAISYLTKTAVPTASTVNPALCFRPSSGRSDATDEKMQRKLDLMKKKMQNKLQSREKTPSS